MNSFSKNIILCRNIKGGCGTTLISLNLAYELSKSLSKKTLLVQLSKFPDLHCYLELTKETSLSTLLDFINENKADEGLGKSVQESSATKFLPSPLKNSSSIFQLENLKKLISTIFSTYRTIIIDLDHSLPVDLTNYLISICRFQLIFCNFDEAGLAKTNQFIQSLKQEIQEKTFTVINQSSGKKFRPPSPVVETRFIASHLLTSLPSSPSEILFNIMNKTPFQSQKKGRLRTGIIKLSENITHLLEN